MSFTVVQPKKKRARKRDKWDWGLDKMYPGLGEWKGFRGGKRK